MCCASAGVGAVGESLPPREQRCPRHTGSTGMQSPLNARSLFAVALTGQQLRNCTLAASLETRAQRAAVRAPLAARADR